MIWQAVLVVVAFAAAMSLRPWRQKNAGALVTPMLASLVILPWLWALPAMQDSPLPLQLQWSGACLVVLMLGWPLAVLALCGIGAIAAVLAGSGFAQALDAIVWLGIVPATFALLMGAAIRKWLGPRMFVYIIGRAFLGSVICLFAAGALRGALGHELPGVETGLSMVGRWLTAWGDGIVTGMLTAVFVAYRPQWLATWSDELYIRKPAEGGR